MESNKKKSRRMLNGKEDTDKISGYGWTCTILLKFGEVKWERKNENFCVYVCQ